MTTTRTTEQRLSALDALHRRVESLRTFGQDIWQRAEDQVTAAASRARAALRPTEAVSESALRARVGGPIFQAASQRLQAEARDVRRAIDAAIAAERAAIRAERAERRRVKPVDADAAAEGDGLFHAPVVRELRRTHHALEELIALTRYGSVTDPRQLFDALKRAEAEGRLAAAALLDELLDAALAAEPVVARERFATSEAAAAALAEATRQRRQLADAVAAHRDDRVPPPVRDLEGREDRALEAVEALWRELVLPLQVIEQVGRPMPDRLLEAARPDPARDEAAASRPAPPPPMPAPTPIGGA